MSVAMLLTLRALPPTRETAEISIFDINNNFTLLSRLPLYTTMNDLFWDRKLISVYKHLENSEQIAVRDFCRMMPTMLCIMLFLFGNASLTPLTLF
jgi:hypothetical protein